MVQTPTLLVWLVLGRHDIGYYSEMSHRGIYTTKLMSIQPTTSAPRIGPSIIEMITN